MVMIEIAFEQILSLFFYLGSKYASESKVDRGKKVGG